MINLIIQLFAMLFAASVTAALHASVFSVLGYNEQALPTGDVGGEFKRVAVNISVRIKYLTVANGNGNKYHSQSIL